MCGGTYSAWDIPRQLTHIIGEPIVARTIRLLKEAGVTEFDDGSGIADYIAKLEEDDDVVNVFHNMK